MEKEFYFPPPIRANQAPWFNNFIQKLKPVYSEFDISDAAYESLKADNATFQHIADRINVYNNAVSLFINTRNILWGGDPDNPNLELIKLEQQPPVIEEVPPPVKPDLYIRLKGMVMQLRQHPKMTETVARQLGILPKEKPITNTANYVPTLNAAVQNGLVVLDCPIKGFAGYEVIRDRSGKNEFEKAGISVGRNFRDKLTLPDNLPAEVRSYRVRMLDSDNEPIGEWSNIITLTLTRAVADLA